MNDVNKALGYMGILIAVALIVSGRGSFNTVLDGIGNYYTNTVKTLQNRGTQGA